MAHAFVLLAVLAAGAAPAAERSFAEEIAAGQEAYGTMALEDALQIFTRAAARPSLGTAEAVLAHVWLGAVKVELGDFKGAEAAFVVALELDRAARPPDGVPPKTLGLFEAARLKVDPPPPPSPVRVPAPLTPVEPDPFAEHAPRQSDDGDGSDEQEENSARDELAPSATAAGGGASRWLFAGGAAAAGAGLLLVGTGAAIDIASGPGALDGGVASNAAYGAGGVVLVLGATLAAVALFAP